MLNPTINYTHSQWTNVSVVCRALVKMKIDLLSLFFYYNSYPVLFPLPGSERMPSQRSCAWQGTLTAPVHVDGEKQKIWYKKEGQLLVSGQIIGTDLICFHWHTNKSRNSNEWRNFDSDIALWWLTDICYWTKRPLFHLLFIFTFIIGCRCCRRQYYCSSLSLWLLTKYIPATLQPQHKLNWFERKRNKSFVKLQKQIR